MVLNRGNYIIAYKKIFFFQIIFFQMLITFGILSLFMYSFITFEPLDGFSKFKKVKSLLTYHNMVLIYTNLQVKPTFDNKKHAFKNCY